MRPSVESFHYSRASAEWGVVRLLASLGTQGRGPIGAHLVVQPDRTDATSTTRTRASPHSSGGC